MNAQQTVLLIGEIGNEREALYHQLHNELGFTKLTVVDKEAYVFQMLEKYESFSVIIIQMHAPAVCKVGFDEFNLIQRLRSDPRYQTVPILFVARKHGDSEGILAETLGANGYITAPFNCHILSDALKDILGHVLLFALAQQASSSAVARPVAK